MIYFLEEFFLNVTVLISFLFLYHQIFRYTSDKPSNKTSIILGVSGGLLGITLMYFGIEANSETIIDIRTVPLMLVTVYGGWISTIITGTMIIIYRFLLGINISSFSSMVLIVGSALVFLIFSKKIKNIWKSVITMLILSNIIFSIITYPLLNDLKLFLVLNIEYWFITIVAGLLAIYMNRYLRTSNKLFKEYQMKAFIDPLTSLNNVRSFDQEFNKAKRRVEKRQEKLAMLVIDIDHFKNVNDTYGHPEGDVILQDVASILIHSSRSSDIISRNGGEEFTVLISDCHHHNVLQIAEKIRKNVAEHNFLINNGTKKINITISIGVATYYTTTNKIDDLYRNADSALYKAKNSGRNKVCSYFEEER